MNAFRPGLAASAMVLLWMSSSSAVVRLLDSQGVILPGGRGVSERVTDLVFPLGQSRCLFVRGLTLHAGEQVLFPIAEMPESGVLRWSQGPVDGVGGGAFVSVDGMTLESTGDGGVLRVPAGAREISVSATTPVRLGEPTLELPPPDDRRPPSVLLITVDTLRRDAVSIWGGPPAATPNLAAFAAECVQFDDAIAPSSWTIPSFVGLFTGRHPLGLGAVGRGGAIPDSVPTLAERLADERYLTHAITQNQILSPGAGFARGFDRYDLFASSNKLARPAARVTDLALRWLRQAPASPWFLWIHYFDPHGDYEPLPDDLRAIAPTDASGFFEVPSPTDPEAIAAASTSTAAVSQARALYDAEVRAVDREIERLLDEWKSFDRIDESIVVVSSDHGEEFLEHGRFGHGHSVHEEQLRIPLLIRFPRGEGGGRRVAGQVTLLDVMPTVLELAGVGGVSEAGPAILRGRSLAGAATGAPIESRPEIAVATLYPEVPDPAYCVRDGVRKFLFRELAATPILSFELTTDPGELNPREAGALDLEAGIPWVDVPERSAAISAEQSARLKSLGYLE